VALALLHILTLCAAPFPFGPLYRSYSILLPLCTPSFVSSWGNCRSVTLCLGNLYCCMGSVLALVVRFASPSCLRPQLVNKPSLSAAGGASSIICSVAKPLRQAVRILQICGWISWNFCPATLALLRGCARRCTLTPLTLPLFAAFACRGSWILSAFCPLVHPLFALLCALLLPAMSCWLGLLLLMR
jgi:hypothetical protein